MSSPLIGITTSTEPKTYPTITLPEAYVDSILEADGIPILIPSHISAEKWEALFNSLDGILFSGGGDIDIKYFDGQNNPSISKANPFRDAIEIELLKLCLQKNKPFLGICRGIQVINVAMGGTLYTHIPDQLNNALEHNYQDHYGETARRKTLHKVELDSLSRLSSIMGVTQLDVNSFHHQGIKNLAKGLDAVGYSSDGLIEAVELKDHPFGMGVQWHPEWLRDQESIRKLFSAFVNSAKKNGK